MKKFFFNSLLILVGLGLWGYVNGMRPDNYEVFLSNLLKKYGIDIRKTESKKKPSKSTTPPQDEDRDDNKREDIRDENQEIVEENTVNVLQPLPRNPFEAIDRRARQCPKKAQATIEALANYLQQNAETDLEKARAIYVWITQNINYDDEEYNSGDYSDMGAESVLVRKKAVCEGFSNLYFALGKAIGLNIEKVSGYAKGYGRSVETPLKKPNHAWNIIKIQGNWRVFDATWGGGSGKNVKGKLVSSKKFDDYWFNVDPYESIFTHLPEYGKHAFVEPLLTSLNQFEQLPAIDQGYFKIGFDARETFRIALSDRNAKFPKFCSFDTYIKKRSAPKYETLFINETYTFSFYIPRGLKAAFVDEKDNWTHFHADKGQFTATYTPNTEGALRFYVQDETDSDSYTTVMQYKVKNEK